MLTLRDHSGTRMLTEEALREEIRAGEVTAEAEVRQAGSFSPITGDAALAAALEAPEARLARRLQSPPLPVLAGLYADLMLIGGLLVESDLTPPSMLAWPGRPARCRSHSPQREGVLAP